MKFLGNVEFRNKNSKPRDYHKTRKNSKGVVVLRVSKTYYPECSCEKCNIVEANKKKDV